MDHIEMQRRCAEIREILRAKGVDAFVYAEIGADRGPLVYLGDHRDNATFAEHDYGQFRGDIENAFARALTVAQNICAASVDPVFEQDGHAVALGQTMCQHARPLLSDTGSYWCPACESECGAHAKTTVKHTIADLDARDSRLPIGPRKAVEL